MRAWGRRAAIGIAAALCLGCGKKGPPLPPAPRGPLPPTQVEVRQIGSAIHFSFLLAQPRGARPTQAPERAELVRIDYPPGSAPPSDPDAFRRRGQVVAVADVTAPSPAARREVVDESIGRPGGERIDWTLRYGVRVLDRRGRASFLVVARDIVPGPTLASPSMLAGEATGDGVRLVWKPPAGEGPVTYNVYRALDGEENGPRPLQREPLSTPEYLDGEVQPGAKYRYEVRTAAGAASPLHESEPSAPVVVLAEDRFAPAAPGKLVVVQEGAAVRLFWNPSPEHDLAGYRVYRALDGGAFERIGSDVVERPSFTDSDVRAGSRASYRVTAVDRAHPPNESRPSEEAAIDVAVDPAVPGPAGP